MKVLENGDYQRDDGTVIPAQEIGKLFKKAPNASKPSAVKEKEELAEGQSSGVIRLED